MVNFYVKKFINFVQFGLDIERAFCYSIIVQFGHIRPQKGASADKKLILRKEKVSWTQWY